MKVKSAVNRSLSGVQSNISVESHIHKVSLTVVGVSACAIGLWAFASLVGGLIASGGPLALVGDWIKAVFGA